VANLPLPEELEEEERENANAAEPEPPDTEPTPTQLNDRPRQSVNGNDNALSTPPSPYCARHSEGTTANCAPCGTARKKRATWEQAQAAGLDAERAAVRAEISACLDCDQNGLTEPDDGPSLRCTLHRQLADVAPVRRAS
jgi:hypothetical protein